MQTIKTAILVLLLLAVAYGFYTALTTPEPLPPTEIAALDPINFEEPHIDIGEPVVLPNVHLDAEPEYAESPAGDFEVEHQSQENTVAHNTAAHSENNNNPDPTRFSGNRPHDDLQTDSISNSRDSQGDLPTAEPTTLRNLDEPQVDPQHKSPEYSESQPVSYSENPATVTVSEAAPSQDFLENPLSETLSEDIAEKPNVKFQDPWDSGAFALAWSRAQDEISRDKFRTALATLSPFFNSPNITEQETEQLLGLLDPLAAKVIYSREHLVEAPYRVRQGDTLYDVATHYGVPWQLLRNINGIRDPDVLVSGTDLKVIPGPFRADVDLTTSELTLFVGDLYAGRFPISLGNDPTPNIGEFQIRDKRTDRAYYAADGTTLPAGHPENPYSNVWLDLGSEICIHGSAESPVRGTLARGCIGLSPIDATDVYGILSKGSTVVIHR